MDESPAAKLISAVDKLDVDAVVALLARDVSVLVADGRRTEGSEAARGLMSEFLGALRECTHRITAQWHVDDYWIAEIEATYALKDGLEAGPLARALVLRQGSDGLSELRVYGADERPLTEHPTGDEGMWVGGRWVPPL
jgi:hypothetical protein